MNSRQVNELAFWRQCFLEEEKGDIDRWMGRRRFDLQDMAGFLWDYLMCETGRGLDLGTGLTSILGFLGALRPVVAADPLMDEYKKLLPDTRSWVDSRQEDGEALSFPDASFDYVWNVNVIDHTPSPERMLSEIRRVLKPGGHFYFSVNYDPALATSCHYTLWNDAMVARMLSGFQLVEGRALLTERYQKYVYRGLYV